MPYNESPFAGTAAYYARYRPPYPAQLIKDIAGHYSLDGKGRLTLPLSHHFESVVAIDIDASMIEEAGRIQKSFSSFRSSDIEWRVMAAEDVSREVGTFRLVTAGSSFHWMDRDLVLRKVQEVLAPGCGIALVGGISAWWEGPEEWQGVVTDVIRRYLGERRMAGGGPATHMEGERFEETLTRNGWRVEFNRDYPADLEWDIDSVIGQLWSSSYANRRLLGERAGEFERELRTRLLKLRPEGIFRETSIFGLVCGRPG
jgi:SAM-dependent methyltransferase